MISLPSIEINFKQLAGSLIARSQRGVAILIVKDASDKAPVFAEYKDMSELEKDKAKFTATNYQYIRDVLGYALNKVVVITVGTVNIPDMAKALEQIEKNVKTGWITIADGDGVEFATLASWIKSKEQDRKTYKAVLHKATAPNCKHIVNFYNDEVEFADERGAQSGEAYCPSIMGILASCNIKRGTTYFECADLKRVEETDDNEKAVSEGKFILINDVDKVKVALGINSMTAIDALTATEDMKFIDIVEAMDLINDDISSVFKTSYLGNYKNNYDNQILLISAVNSYFKQLADDYVLDGNHLNKVDVDVVAQRAAWAGVGKVEAENWTVQEVKNNPFKRTVFLIGDIKILGAMENLKLNISLV